MLLFEEIDRMEFEWNILLVEGHGDPPGAGRGRDAIEFENHIG
jgi:hypothetical protein